MVKRWPSGRKEGRKDEGKKKGSLSGSTKERNGETAYVVKIVIVKIVIIPPPLCTCLERGRTKEERKVYVNIFLIYNIIYIIIYIILYIKLVWVCWAGVF